MHAQMEEYQSRKLLGGQKINFGELLSKEIRNLSTSKVHLVIFTIYFFTLFSSCKICMWIFSNWLAVRVCLILKPHLTLVHASFHIHLDVAADNVECMCQL
jgi:hypothetical protein